MRFVVNLRLPPKYLTATTEIAARMGGMEEARGTANETIFVASTTITNGAIRDDGRRIVGARNTITSNGILARVDADTDGGRGTETTTTRIVVIGATVIATMTDAAATTTTTAMAMRAIDARGSVNVIRNVTANTNENSKGGVRAVVRNAEGGMTTDTAEASSKRAAAAEALAVKEIKKETRESDTIRGGKNRRTVNGTTTLSTTTAPNGVAHVKAAAAMTARLLREAQSFGTRSVQS